jgi:hypothetical protein
MPDFLRLLENSPSKRDNLKNVKTAKKIKATTVRVISQPKVDKELFH